MKTNYGKILRNGILDENPIFRLVLGMCSTLAITTSVSNGFGMGMAATFVLVGSNVVISLLRNFIPDKVRIPCYIVVIATFTTIVQLLMEAFLPVSYTHLDLDQFTTVISIARTNASAKKNAETQPSRQNATAPAPSPGDRFAPSPFRTTGPSRRKPG